MRRLPFSLAKKVWHGARPFCFISLSAYAASGIELSASAGAAVSAAGAAEAST